MTAEPTNVHTVTSPDGTTIAFERSGEGPPVIVVGGALTDRTWGAQLVEHLASDLTVYTYDRRGRGDSADAAPYAVEREVEDLAALITAAGGEAFVYGVSSGAILALEAAASGLPITRLALHQPPYEITETDPNESENLAAGLADLTSAGRRGEAVEYFLTNAIGLPDEAVAGTRNSPMWAGFEAMAHTLVYDTTIAGDGSMPTDRMASVPVPTLVIDSDEGGGELREAAKAVADALPQGQHRSVGGPLHEVPPEDLAPVLKQFFVG